MFGINKRVIIDIISGAGVLSSLSNILMPSYGIYYASGENTGKRVFSPTSFFRVRNNTDAHISTAPTEAKGADGVAGGYVGYNKVVLPSVIYVEFGFEGLSGYSGNIPNIFNLSLDTRAGILNALESMSKKTGLYDIETPDKLYQGYDLTHYSHGSGDGKGVTLLTVNAVFQKVNTTMEVILGGANQKEREVESEAVETQSTLSSTSAADEADMLAIFKGEDGVIHQESSKVLL